MDHFVSPVSSTVQMLQSRILGAVRHTAPEAHRDRSGRHLPPLALGTAEGYEWRIAYSIMCEATARVASDLTSYSVERGVSSGMMRGQRHHAVGSSRKDPR
jgi:hypothetical protein